eukprot:7893369-Alexandrium_andersonii.AAC.1
MSAEAAGETRIVECFGEQPSWNDMMSGWLRTALSWLDGGFLPDLIAVRLAQSARRASLQIMLATSSLQWERDQQGKLLREGRRQYKIVMRCFGDYSAPALLRVGSLATTADSEWEVVPRPC